MKHLVFPVVVFACAGLFAVPKVKNVALTPNLPNSIEVTYDLADEPAIVTLAVSTNGVAVEDSRVVSLTGDVCRRIESGEGKKLHWAIGRDWPGAELPQGLAVTVLAWPTNSPPPYMAVDLTVKSNLFFYASADSVPGGDTNRIYKTTMMLMRRIPAAGIQWRMGSPSGETGRQTNGSEDPHLVTLSSDYYMAVYPITQRQWKIFNSTKTFNYNDGDETLPAESFGWTNLRGQRTQGYSWPQNMHTVKSDSLLGKMRAFCGLELDLPTEAQWEYACRAGSSGPYADGLSEVDGLGWYSSLTNRAVGVGLKNKNAWGLYDMHGNVWELCLDWYSTGLTGPVEDPKGPDDIPADTEFTINSCVVRGGSHGTDAANCRSARRRPAKDFSSKDYHKTVGGRLVCPVAVW